MLVESTDLIPTQGATGQAAFERLARPLIVPAHRLAFALLHDRTAAEDAVQNASLKAWRHFSRLRDESLMRPWFLAIVANECRTMLRGRWWRTLRFAEPPEAAGPGLEPVGAIDLRAALARLKPDDRVVLCLHYYLDLPHDEVGATLGLSTGAVKTRIHRAIARLRREMGSQEGEES